MSSLSGETIAVVGSVTAVVVVAVAVGVGAAGAAEAGVVAGLLVEAAVGVAVSDLGVFAEILSSSAVELAEEEDDEEESDIERLYY
jgi:hypothetical protein